MYNDKDSHSLILEKEQFYAYLNGDLELNQESLQQLKELTEEFPYFQSARLLLIKNMKKVQDPEFFSELAHTAITCDDREKLFYYLNDERFNRFFADVESGKDSSKNDRTGLLLDSFLETIDKKDYYNSVDENESSDSRDHWEGETIVSTDYLAYLEQTEEQTSNTQGGEALKHQGLVDRFLEKSSNDELLFSSKESESNKKKETSEDVDNLLDDDSFFTETLAQVYIKQKKYEQALAIIKKLSLNFPKKSIYFADQIRFLEYLIYNDKNKKQK